MSIQETGALHLTTRCFTQSLFHLCTRQTQEKYNVLMLKTSKVFSDGSTQTEVDEYGLWDKQDGWSMPLTHTRDIRRRWREGMRFAGCPSCRGSGKFVASVAGVENEDRRSICRPHNPPSRLLSITGLLRKMARGQLGSDGNVPSPKRANQLRKKSRRPEVKWTIPDELVQFMVNLPRSILAQRHHGKKTCIAQRYLQILVALFLNKRLE
jgi:hypothetical protein